MRRPQIQRPRMSWPRMSWPRVKWPDVLGAVRSFAARRGRAAVRLLVVMVTVGGVVFLFVLPGRTWLSQTRAMSLAQHQAQVLSQENKALRIEAGELQSTSYVAQIAHQQYGLVLPGETAYGILPPTATTVPPTSPATLPETKK